jgi:hypothetical protein
VEWLQASVARSTAAPYSTTTLSTSIPTTCTPKAAQLSRRFDLGRRVIQMLRLVGLTDVAVERDRVLTG